jgi:hypothetical protein
MRCRPRCVETKSRSRSTCFIHVFTVELISAGAGKVQERWETYGGAFDRMQSRVDSVIRSVNCKESSSVLVFPEGRC